MKLKITYNKRFILMNSLLFIFCLTRIQRNSFDYSNNVNGGIWNIITLLFLGFSIYYVLYDLLKKEKINKLVLFLLVYIISNLIIGLFNIKYLSLSNIYNWLMGPYFAYPIICFYYSYGKGVSNLDKKICLLFFYIILMYTLYGLVLYKLGILKNNMVANVYYPLSYFPLVLMWSNNKMIPISLLAIAIAFSSKRVGILCFFGMLFLYFFVKAYFEKNIKKFIINFIECFIFLFIVIYLFNYISNEFGFNIMDRFSTLKSDGGSGRDVIYITIINALINSDSFSLLFGHGYGSLSKLLIEHNSAHNDFLEIIYNYGIMIFLLFVYFYYFLIKITEKMFINKYQRATYFLISVFISLLLSLFSNNANDFTYITCTSACIGIIYHDYLRRNFNAII